MTSASDGSVPVSFLHRMDCLRGEELVVSTTRADLRRASFLDGRETCWTSEQVVPLHPEPLGTRPAKRFIFHVGFCGSTLLARLIDEPDAMLVLKEPQCLADIAGQRRAIADGEAVAPLDALIGHALDRLGAVGGEDPVVIKPTNWVNSLLPLLCAPERTVRAVFVSMDRRAYLGAIFRGGRARLEFCSRLAAEVAPTVPDGDRLLREAIASTAEPFDRVARICAVLHALQERLFDAAISANGWPSDARIDFSDLMLRPDEIARKACALLDLEVTDTLPDRAAVVMARHTKDVSRSFSAAEREGEDREIERHHGRRFDETLEWLSQTTRDRT